MNGEEFTPPRILIIADRDASTEMLRAAVATPLGSADGEAADGSDASVQTLTREITDVRSHTEAIDLIRDAAATGDEYAVAFVDLPLSGRDLLQQLEPLLTADADLQIVVCVTAQDDVALEAATHLSELDRVLFQIKPLHGTTMWALARGLARRRQTRRDARAKMDRLERSVDHHTAELQHVMKKLTLEMAGRAAAEDRLRHHALHDHLTGLPNRLLLIDRLERCVARAGRNPNYHFAVLCLDIDDFKLVNDSLGPRLGDRLLVEIANRLRASLRGIDTVSSADDTVTARLGGDEFVILLDGLRYDSDAAIVCDRLLRRVSEPVDLEGESVVVSASIGVALHDGPTTKVDALLRDADIAMYRAKGSGGARYAIFDREMHTQAITRLYLQNDLRRAVEEQQFELVYQPIIAVDTGCVHGFEALIRWNHPHRGVLYPDDFILVAEETGHVIPMGRWAIGEACRQLSRWKSLCPDGNDLSISVNLSGRQLGESCLCAEVDEALKEHGLTGAGLELEVTESAIIENAATAINVLEQIKRLGVRIHMDDFGTGYSSLSSLHRLPLDVVKIDRAFMATMAENRDYVAVVHGIITIAHNLGMQVTVEGVEKSDQLAQIIALDCDYAQGFLFSKPLTAADAELVVLSDRRWPMSA